MEASRPHARPARAVVLSGLSLAASLTCAQSGGLPASTPSEEVVTIGQTLDSATEATPMTERLVGVAGTLGDPFRAIAALPGVIQPSEGGGEPAVRGSGPDDNFFLIDGLPAGYLFHDLGNSIINEDILRDFGFVPAAFDARYGQASGAIFDIELREPRPEPLTRTMDISMLRAGALFESRITDKQAFYVSFRESLLHLLLDSAYGEDERTEDDIAIDRYPRARDLQAKYIWHAGPRHDLSVTLIGAQDDAAVSFGPGSEDALVDPGVAGAAATTTTFSSGGLSWIYRHRDFEVTTRLGRLSQSDDQTRGDGREFIDLDLDQWTFKSTIEWPAGTRLQFAGGLEYRQQVHDYAVRYRYRSCTAFSPDCDTTLGSLTAADRTQTIGFTEAFAENTFSPTSRLDLTIGLRYSRNDYLRGEFLEPRLRISWRRSDQLEFHAATGRYHQMPEIVQIVPTFGNPDLRPIRARHFVLGLVRSLGDDWSMTAELYHKRFGDLVVETGMPANYLNGATGRANGVELMIMRDSGRWHGWGTLSLARTERTNGLTGLTSLFDTDAPVVVNLVLGHELTPIWTLGLRWQFRSGMPYTPIVANETNPDFPTFYRPVYGELNTERAGDYHRLDLRVERPVRIARAEGKFYVDILNVYARTNTGAAKYEPIAGSAEYRLTDDDGLPFLPSVGLKIQW